MKKLLLSTFLLLMLGFTSTANIHYLVNDPLTQKHPPKTKKINNSSHKLACTVTRNVSHSVTGSDCDGNPFTVTATRDCTISDVSCSQADTRAYNCAWSLAVAEADASASAITADCPAPIEP